MVMAGKAPIDAALSALVGKVVREVMASQIGPLKEEVRDLAHRAERIRVPVKRRKRKKPGPKPSHRECSVVGCKSKHSGLGFCQSHYNHFNYLGTLDEMAGLVEAGKQVREETACTRRRPTKATLRKSRARKKAGKAKREGK
jgi:hypothetical protein